MDAHEAFLKKYENHRFYDIYPVTIVLVCIASFGIFGNFNIVWSSWRKRTLRSHCNILIASVAFADVFTQLSHFTLAYCLFFGSTFIPLEHCFWLQAIPCFFMNFAAFTVLVIGMDRLFSVLMPVAYKRFNSKFYIMFMLSFPLAFGCFIIFVSYSALNKHGQEKTFCLIASAIHDSVKPIWINGTLIINIAIIIVYSLMWATVKVKKGKYDKRIIRSLIVIMSLCLFGWFAGSLIFSIALAMGFHEEELVKIMMYTGTIFINPAIAMNYPVYMFFCKEYRVAFLEQLRIIRCKNKTSPYSVSTTSNTAHHASSSDNRITSDINSEVF